MRETDILDLISTRADDLAEWLDANAPEARDEQLHTEPGAPERAYWHLGYHAAVRDIERLLRKRAN